MAKKRRGRGEGSIYQRQDGRWCAVVSFGHNEKGQRRRRTIYGKTKSEVQNQILRLSAKGSSGGLSDPSRQTVAAYLDEWMAGKSQHLKRTTLHQYKRVVKNHLKPFFGSLRMGQLSDSHVQQLFESIESPFNRSLSYAVLRSAIRDALRRKRIPSNPCDLVEPPKRPKRPIKTVSVPDIEKLLEHSKGTRYHALIVLAVMTGMRQGELFGLQMSDWDREHNTICVQRSLTQVNNVTALEEPKTEKSRRLIPLPQQATDALKEHLKFVVASGQQNGFMFTGAKGKPLIKTNFHSRFYVPLFEKAGVQYVKFHNLRHTMASLLLRAGVHPKVVQERLGHSSISMTMDTYSHLIPTLQREAAEKLQSIFGT